MAKDKLTSEQIGKLLLEVLKITAKYDHDRMDRLWSLVDVPKPTRSLRQIRDEISYLSIYIIYQALFLTFKSDFDRILACFKEELKQYIEGKSSKYFADLSMLNILEAIKDYMGAHNNMITDSNNSKGLAKFARYISTRILGEEVGNDIRYVMYFTDFYVTGLTSLTDLIKENIE